MTPSAAADPGDAAGSAAAPAIPAFATRGVGGVAALAAVILTALSGRYGVHRDELYFLAAGNHPAWGYVDQPPLTPMLARLAADTLGPHPEALRVVATVATVATVILAALIARELGARSAPQILTALAVTTSSFVLTVGHMLSTPTLDLPIWLGVSLLTLRMLRTGDPRWLIAVGALIGIGLQNKLLIALPVIALAGAVLIVGPRAILLSRWTIPATMLAALIAAPTVIWQVAHGMPQLDVARDIGNDDGAVNRMTFLPYLVVYLAPPYVLLWAVGLRRLWRSPEMRWARAFAVTVLLVAGVLVVTGGKAYYVVGMLIIPLAAGAGPVWDWCAHHRARWAVAVAVVVSAAVNAVIALPVLPVRSINPVNAINREQGEQVGWPALADAVAVVWHRIPPDAQRTAVVVTQNYGQAGAIDRYGLPLGLPRAYSGHMSYAAWGPPPDTATGPVVLVRFPDDRRLRSAFAGCRGAGRVDNGITVDNTEQGTVIEVCRGPRQPWSQIWPSLRHY